jgi:hypothetical protein
MAQMDGDSPDWFHEIDPLDTLVLGTVWPRMFRDGYEFGVARTAWLRLLRTTAHWPGIERFVTEVLDASDEHDLPVDDGQLMLLVAGRLEAAGLDRRKLPAALLPAQALAGSRAVRGPDPDLPLPDPPPDAAARVARFWASTGVDLPHDGTPADALREGLHLLGRAGLDVRGSVDVLLPALYLALVADEHERVDEAGERAGAWAWALPDDSPLVAVVDVLVTAAQRELDVDATLAHLFARPAFTTEVPAADRVFTADPGGALITVAAQLGYQQVRTRDSKVMVLDAGHTAGLSAQVRAFEEKFGRPPGPHDPIFFDPHADDPRPISATDLERATTGMLEMSGICGAWIYAYQHTDGLLPLPDGGFNSAADQREWDEHIQRYLRSHPGETVDHDAEVGKLRGMLAMTSIATVATDPELGASLAQRLDQDLSELDSEADVVAELLDASAEQLCEHLDDPAVAAAAAELARAWGGTALADRIRDAATPGGDADRPALLAIAAAHLTTLHT